MINWFSIKIPDICRCKNSRTYTKSTGAKAYHEFSLKFQFLVTLPIITPRFFSSKLCKFTSIAAKLRPYDPSVFYLRKASDKNLTLSN